MKTKLFIFFLYFMCVSITSCQKNSQVKIHPSDLLVADSMLTNILVKFDVPKYGLLSETYPVNPDNKVTYLTEGAEQKQNQEVSFLWPYSGMLSGCISLYKTTGDNKYLKILEEQIIPGLELYWDNKREPFCYQSYPMFNGESDRFYDDNDWLAIDFCDLYALTNKKGYLDKAEELHRYIYSGWDDTLGGGIYWCEQNKSSKNTCSNAPATVLCMKLYNATGNKDYLDQAKKTYYWIKSNLLDPKDHVYWDNIRVNGDVDKAKYTYNSGQMIQAGVLLYHETKDKIYLEDARRTAKGAYEYFVKKRKDITGDEKLFYPPTPWFNVILLRGLTALYEVDNNPLYIQTMADNARFAWNNTRDENGFLSEDWVGMSEKKYKWLLDNASMIELYSEISRIK